MQIAKVILLIVSALFPIVNPLGGSPIFLSLTKDYPVAARRALAWKVAMNSFVLLIISFVIGTHILRFFGISIPVVQVGGGLIVAANGWALLKQHDQPERRGALRRTVDPTSFFQNAFYPLTLPLTVGPGSISVAITLGANEPNRFGTDILAIVAAAIATVVIALSIYLCYGFADRLASAVGESGMNIMLRLSAFLLVCIGVQIMWNGIRALARTAGVG